MCLSLEQDILGSHFGPVKSDTALPTARHHCDILSKRAVLLGRNDAEMGPANLLQASAFHSEYNERFDFYSKNAQNTNYTIATMTPIL